MTPTCTRACMNLHQNRHDSQFMGLQLTARYEGIETPVYEQAQAHHRS